jgi:molybdopterin/thiamine biosynthesis adenylyltransferase
VNSASNSGGWALFRDAVEQGASEVSTPLFFGFTSEEGREYEAFLAFARSHGVLVRDPIEHELLDWARTELPAEPAGSPVLRARMAEVIGAAGGARFACGTWCYFPWRRAVIHLLDHERFFAVRTNRNRNKITAEEQALLAQKRIGVVGLSVGAAAALVLAQEGLCGELRIADFDVIELSNLNRLRTSLLHLGESKAHVAARELAETDPYLTVRVFPEGVTEDNLERFLLEGGPLDVLVEECDTLPMKLRVREAARAHGIPVVMDTNDRGLLDIERFDREPERPLLHGLLGTFTAASARTLDATARRELFFSFFGGQDQLSPRLHESMPRIGKELVSFPQLGSDVHLGAALVAHAVREILLGRLVTSGRYRVDLHELVTDGTPWSRIPETDALEKP